VALVLGRDLDLGVHTVADVIGAVDYVLPALEIVDSRIAGLGHHLRRHGRRQRVVGSLRAGHRPGALDGLDLAAVEMSMRVNGEGGRGRGSACLGNPLIAGPVARRHDVARGTRCAPATWCSRGRSGRWRP
jgi:2-keto-4-pentenoate hydratase